MSLENKIEALTLAIEKLTAVINSDIQQDFGQAVTKEVEKVVEQVQSEPEFVSEAVVDSPIVDHDTFKNACLKVARSGKKDEVKAIIESYGVKKSTEVPVEKLGEALAKVEGL